MRALIVGTAACVWQDLKPLDLGDFEVFTVNDMGFHFPGVYSHWVSSHNVYFMARRFREWRWKHKFTTHGVQASEYTDKFWDFKPALGCDSAGLAARIAFELGADSVLMAGCPQDDSPHYYSKPGLARGWTSPEDAGDTYSGKQVGYWEWLAAQYPGRIRAMSGLIHEMFGGTQ